MTALNAVALQTDPAWTEIARRVPKLAATMGRYLDQIAVSLRPSSVIANDNVLRMFAAHIIATDPKTRSVARINRAHIEDYKRALMARRTRSGTPLSTNTLRMRLGMLRTFFERIIEWGYDDAPPRVPVLPPTSPRPTSRCLGSSTTPPPPGSCAPPPTIPTPSAASWSSCSPAPGCESANSAASKRTPSPA